MPTDNDTPDEEQSLRDTLDAAFAQHATNEPADKPADPAAAPPAQPQDAPGAPAAPSGADGRARDEQGRFAPKGEPPGAAPAVKLARPAGAAPLPSAAPAPPNELKPPASWRPEARELWNQVPPGARQEVMRREYEMQHLLQQTANERGFTQAFERVTAPYEVFFRQEGVNSLQAVQAVLQTAAELRVGSSQNKVGIIANLIRQHGVDLNMLDWELTPPERRGANGAQQPQPQQQQGQVRDPRVDHILGQQQFYLQQLARQEDQAMGQQLLAFGQAHEFYADVAGIMADLVEVRARQGQPIDLEKIYAHACQMHDGVHSILSQRGAPAQRNGTSQAVLRAKRAAVSVKGDAQADTGAHVPKDDSVRAALEAAIEQHGAS